MTSVDLFMYVFLFVYILAIVGMLVNAFKVQKRSATYTVSKCRHTAYPRLHMYQLLSAMHKLELVSTKTTADAYCFLMSTKGLYPKR